ncbi:MAG: hypothetical protein IPJ69_12115 [Deltaproteobacteria bacterium]|nr:MAG: hypothetical protein IPJ69_12115 [Deltaproteobacteria bacterium]
MTSLSRLSQSLVLAAAATALPAEALGQNNNEPPHAVGAYYRFQHIDFPQTATSYDAHGAMANLSLGIFRRDPWRVTVMFEGFWTSGFTDVTSVRERHVSYLFQEVNNLTLSFHPWRWLSMGVRLALSFDGSSESTQTSSSTRSTLPHDRFGGIPTRVVRATRDTSRVNLGLRAEWRTDFRIAQWLQVGGSVTFNDVSWLDGSTTPSSNLDTSSLQFQGRVVVTIPIESFALVGEARDTYSLGRDPATGNYSIPNNQLELRLGAQYRF